MNPKSRTVARAVQVDSPQRYLPLIDVLVDARTELMELAVTSGLQVLQAMLEEDRTASAGLTYQHQVGRAVGRAGTVASEVVLGGRKVAIRRPRARAGGTEVTLPTFQTMANEDPLNQRVVEQMLVGVATLPYARSLDPAPRDHGEPRNQQERCQSPLRREDSGTIGGVAIDAARWVGPRRLDP